MSTAAEQRHAHPTLSRECALDGCDVSFQPVTPNQRYCVPAHKRKASRQRNPEGEAASERRRVERSAISATADEEAVTWAECPPPQRPNGPPSEDASFDFFDTLMREVWTVVGEDEMEVAA